MNKTQTFKEFLATHTAKIPVSEFFFNLLIVFALSIVLAWVYNNYGQSLANRKKFAANFVIMSLTTMLIITIVKSSLALSLGLVGALSIIRFRAAIKEPEELTYLFVAIAIGLGLGANQRLITVVGVAFILLVIILKQSLGQASEVQQSLLTLSANKRLQLSITDITNLLKESCAVVDLKRFDESERGVEILFKVEFADIQKIEFLRQKVRQLDDSLQVSVMDAKIY